MHQSIRSDAGSSALYLDEHDTQLMSGLELPKIKMRESNYAMQPSPNSPRQHKKVHEPLGRLFRQATTAVSRCATSNLRFLAQ